MGLFPKDRDLSQAPDRVSLEVRASDFQLRPDEVEIRLDAFLCRHLSWRSRTSIQKLVRDGSVLVEHAAPDQREQGELRVERRKGRQLHHGARVVVMIPPELRLTEVASVEGELKVLFEDEECLLIDKQPNVAVHPGGRYLTGTLIQKVHARYRAVEEGSGREVQGIPIRLCHRLDRETSGVILLGKGEFAHSELMGQFERRRVEKEYFAIVHGEPEQDCGVVDYDIGPALTGEIRLKMAVCAKGLASRTEWEVLERVPGFALVACRPHTGRQHQIRVHLDAIGHPLVGDKLYGVEEGVFLRAAAGESSDADREQLLLPRHALHNHRLVFHMPSGGERREIVSPLPADLRAFLDAQ
jgi:23S rRNA pseudouridine1911/1915/1917 synthase